MRNLLVGIPGVLVHGRFDLASPVEAAWQLAAAWPGAELHLHDAGHGGDEQAARYLLAAAARFSETRQQDIVTSRGLVMSELSITSVARRTGSLSRT